MARQPKGRPAIYQGSDGLYHTFITVGTKPDGTPDRKHIKRKSAEQVAAALEETLKRLRQGSGKLAKIETLEQWLQHWVHVIVAGKRDAGTLAASTFDDYETISRVHLMPHLGQWRITGARRRLEPEHIEAMYVALRRKDLAPSYVVRIHRVLCIALKLAYKRGRADRNVMELVEAPEFRAKKVSALTQAEATAVLEHALRDPLAARWALGILAGPRQGEVLGIRWTNVDLDPQPPDVPSVRLVSQIQRRPWKHGCDDPVACALRHCRTKPCPRGCKRHLAKTCPPPCVKGCTRHAKGCPQRRDGGLLELRLKTHASEEPLALGSAITELFRRHREAQIRDGCFDPQGFVFCDHAGKPINPRTDYRLWCELLQRAGVKHHPLHAARHTAGTFLRATGSDLKLIQQVLRHADLAMSGRYVDVAMEAKRDAVDRVAAALLEGDLSALLGAKRVA